MLHVSLVQADEPQKYRLEEGDGTAHAQRIVRELYLIYEKQLQRWKDYRNLFAFLGFVALFLAVLYLQRNADISYKVHNTVESVVLPADNVMQTTDEVYSWLDGLLTVSRVPEDTKGLPPPPCPREHVFHVASAAGERSQSSTELRQRLGGGRLEQRRGSVMLSPMLQCRTRQPSHGSVRASIRGGKSHHSIRVRRP